MALRSPPRPPPSVEVGLEAAAEELLEPDRLAARLRVPGQADADRDDPAVAALHGDGISVEAVVADVEGVASALERGAAAVLRRADAAVGARGRRVRVSMQGERPARALHSIAVTSLT